MPMSLTKAQLVKKISSDTGYTQKKSSEILATLLSIITAELAKGESISIRGFGKFYTIKQTARKMKWSDPLKLHKSERSDQSVLRGVRC
jgi:nucleoid DNA-binding protein